VGRFPIGDCRASELCVQERLLDELNTLSTRGFAPLVINEFGTISDGNHRLTASWIWNILAQCLDCQWDLSDIAFQRRVARIVSNEKIEPVSLHEALRHIALLLQNSSTQEMLNCRLRNRIRQTNLIKELPIVLLSEYSAVPVAKHLYDNGTANVRVRPGLYQALSRNSMAVLPARGQYHFTDCAPLPWFNVLRPQ
jgi:hypothetical protein